MATAEPVTVAVINYNGGPGLAETVASLRRMDYPSFAVLVVDNASTDDSLACLSARAPEVSVVRLAANLGPSGARNAALRASPTNRVFLSDNDIEAEAGMLTRLMDAMQQDARAAICAPRVLYSDGRTVQSDGVRMHYLAMPMVPNRHAPLAEVPVGPPRVHVCGNGGMMLVDKTRMGPVEGFDEDYFFGWDDVEFSYRLTLAGYACLTVPAAVVRHMEKKWGTRRSFYQVRNRWYFLLIVYARRTLLLIAPMLVVYEFALALFMLAKGEGRTYLRAMRDVLRHAAMLKAKRRAVQATRVRRDADLLATGAINVERGLVNQAWLSFLVRLLNGGFNAYWQAARRLLVLMAAPAAADL